MKCIVCSNDSEFTRLSPDLCATDNWLCRQCGLVFIPRAQGVNDDYYKKGGYYTTSPNLAGRRSFPLEAGRGIEESGGHSRRAERTELTSSKGRHR